MNEETTPEQLIRDLLRCIKAIRVVSEVFPTYQAAQLELIYKRIDFFIKKG